MSATAPVERLLGAWAVGATLGDASGADAAFSGSTADRAGGAVDALTRGVAECELDSDDDEMERVPQIAAATATAIAPETQGNSAFETVATFGAMLLASGAGA